MCDGLHSDNNGISIIEMAQQAKANNTDIVALMRKYFAVEEVRV